MPRVYGNLNLEFGSITNFSFGAQDDFPVNTKPGDTILKDGRLMTCTKMDGGLPLWVPLTQQISMKTYNQVGPSSRWTFAHNMNIGAPVVQTWDELGEQMMPSRIVVVDTNTIEAFFTMPVAGAMTVMAGVDSGIPAADIAFQTDILEESTTWEITHNLGYNPKVDVMIEGFIVQPLRVLHDSTAQLTITFTTPRAGRVILV